MAGAASFLVGCQREVEQGAGDLGRVAVGAHHALVARGLGTGVGDRPDDAEQVDPARLHREATRPGQVDDHVVEVRRCSLVRVREVDDHLLAERTERLGQPPDLRMLPRLDLERPAQAWRVGRPGQPAHHWPGDPGHGRVGGLGHGIG